MKRFLLIALFAMLTASCVPRGGVIRADFKEHESALKGPFKVILYGHPDRGQPEAAAVADLADDGYTIEPRANDYMYTIVNAPDAAEARARAKEFLQQHDELSAIRERVLVGTDGTVYGIEYIPMYAAITPDNDVDVYTYYAIKDGGVIKLGVLTKEPRMVMRFTVMSP